MKMKTFNFRMSDMALALTTLLMATALGCAKSSDNGGNGGGGAAVVQTCAPNVPCAGLPPSNIGFYAESQSMKTYNSSNSILTPNSGYATFLKEALGVCDREQYTGGLASCTSWINGYHDLVFMLDSVNSNSVRVVVRSYPQSQGGSYYSYQLPRWDQFFLGLVGFPIAQNPSGFFNPMILNGTIYPINASQGFEIRAYGPQISYGYNKLLQLQIASGKIQDTQFGFILNWNGQAVANGTMVRCQTQNCGL
jgi:hypothetical protein